MPTDTKRRRFTPQTLHDYIAEYLDSQTQLTADDRIGDLLSQLGEEALDEMRQRNKRRR